MAKDILFIHQNFPGQFRHLAVHLAQQADYRVLALGQKKAPGLTGIKLIRYTPKRPPAKSTHHYVKSLESGILAGQAVVEILLELKRQGFCPEVVIAHPGWGESLFVKDVFPQARLIHYCEWYYSSEGADVGFDPAYPVTIETKARVRSQNALQLLALEACDMGVSPTHWQKSRFPAEYQYKIQVIHEGIDITQAKPNLDAKVNLADGRQLSRQDPVLTYVARNLEPYRGFLQFMRALEIVQQQHPTVQTLIVGGDGVSYGSKPKDAANWREKMLREVSIDPHRTHFLGKIPFQQYLNVLQISSAHVYLTYPFVLSWSLLEAMACGCNIIASDTAPVREVIRHGENGVLVDFFDVQAIGMLIGGQLNQQKEVINEKIILEKFCCNRGLNLYSSLLE